MLDVVASIGHQHLLDEVRIRVTPVSPEQELFVGIGPSTDVDRYLAGVNHTVITEFWEEKVDAVAGGSPASAPQGLASITGSPWRGSQRSRWA